MSAQKKQLKKMLLGMFAGGGQPDIKQLLPMLAEMDEEEDAGPQQLTIYRHGFGLALYARESQALPADAIKEALDAIAFEPPPPMPLPGQPMPQDMANAIALYNARANVRATFFDLLALEVRNIMIRRKGEGQPAGPARPPSSLTG